MNRVHKYLWTEIKAKQLKHLKKNIINGLNIVKLSHYDQL